MAKNKKTETAKAEEAVVMDVQVDQPVADANSFTETEIQSTNEIEEVEESPKSESTEKTKKNSKKSEEVEVISARDAELMRLYPQYEKIWITPRGFVHPEGTPEYLLKGAKLFKNKFFNKSN